MGTDGTATVRLSFAAGRRYKPPMPTILAVDDSATMRTCLEITFEGTEFDLVLCDNAALALSKVASLRPALVLVDASLPPTSGYDLCAAIKGSAPHVPVVLLTSKQHPFEPVRGSVLEGHVEKPFDTQALYDKVKDVLAGGVKAPLPSPPMLDGAVDLSKTMSFGDVTAPPVAARPSIPPPLPHQRASAGAELAVTPPSAEEIDVELGGDDDLVFDDPLPEPPKEESLPSPVSPVSPVRARSVTATWELPPEVSAMRDSFVAATKPGLAPAFATPLSPVPAPVPAVVAPPLEEEPPSEQLPPRAVTASWEVPEGMRNLSSVAPPALGAFTGSAPLPGVLAAHEASFGAKLEGLGLSEEQVRAVVAISRDVIERVAWEVVPTLAETIIKEELRRLTQG